MNKNTHRVIFFLALIILGFNVGFVLGDLESGETNVMTWLGVLSILLMMWVAKVSWRDYQRAKFLEELNRAPQWTEDKL